jgi:hypothetical protein
MATIGQSFRLGAGGHLWLIITHPDGASGSFVMVNVTTLDDDVVDISCILHKGDHPDVHHDSVVFYADAQEWFAAGDDGCDANLKANTILSGPTFTQPVLRRIQDGALASSYFKKKFRPRVLASLV